MLVLLIGKKIKRARSITKDGIKIEAVIAQVILKHFSKGLMIR